MSITVSLTPMMAARHAALVGLADGDGLIPMRCPELARHFGISEAAARQMLIQFHRRGLTQSVPVARGRVAYRLVRGVTVAASAPVHPGPTPRADHAVDARPAPPPRCPFCNLRADDPLCRHGWDGWTTRAQRRATARLIAATTQEQGGEQGRA